MNIVMISTGALEYATELANAMAEHHRVSLLVSRRDFSYLTWAVSPKVDLHLLEWPRQRDPRSLLFTMRVYRLVEHLQPDVVHFLSGQTWLNALLPLLNQVVLISTTHDVVPHLGDAPSRKIPAFIGSFASRRAHRLIAHGEKIKAELMDLYHVPGDRIDVLPHGVLSLYRQLLPASDGNGAQPAQDTGHAEVLFFGRIYKYKGLDYLIQAQPAITRAVPHARIVIAGRGENFDRYQAMFPEPDKFIVYNEFISNKRVAELFDRARVVVLPYVEASQSGVLQVAYAFGKPVVATRVGSIDEALDEGRSGLLVAPQDPHGLADAIIELLRNQDLWDQMHQYIDHQVATKFSWTNIARATIRTYHRAMADCAGKVVSGSNEL